jgi:outer membrane receptor for ferrienterochelin and colicin
MNKYLILLSLTFSSFVFSFDEMDGLLDLSLEELVQLKVVTVSKREESLVDAPGVISVYSSEEINRFGARNLKDVLLRIPNLYLFDSYAFSGMGMTLRAGATQHTNNHVLYLINGRPLRESQNGGRQTDINLLYPISAIDRIEVIRGPGSVLYGSNAFNGAINIITKKVKQGVEAGIKVSVGQDNYKAIEANASASSESGATINTHFKVLDEDGDSVSALDDQRIEGTNQLYRKGYFARLDGGYNGLAIEAMASEIKLSNIGGPFQWANLDEWTHKRQYVNLGYSHEFNQDWSSSLNYTLNKITMDLIQPTLVEFTSDGYLFELTVNGKLNQNTDVVMGVVRDDVKGDLDYRGGEYSYIRNSIYAQLDYRFNQKTKVTAGFQVNKPEEQDSHISPRLALVHKFNDKWSIKALYAEAFRSPFGTEMGFESGFLKGNENLIPETIQTKEIQLNYASTAASISTTIYQSKTNDLIGRSRIGNATYFVNIEQEITYNGIELEGKWPITPNLHLVGNATYQETEDDEGRQNIMIGSNEMVKVGLSYQTEFGITASLWNNYFGEVSKLEDILGQSVIVQNPEASSVNLLSVNILTNVGELFDAPRWDNAQISIYADNLLDEDVWFPEMGQKSVNTYPQSHARGIYLSISMDY